MKPINKPVTDIISFPGGPYFGPGLAFKGNAGEWHKEKGNKPIYYSESPDGPWQNLHKDPNWLFVYPGTMFPVLSTRNLVWAFKNWDGDLDWRIADADNITSTKSWGDSISASAASDLKRAAQMENAAIRQAQRQAEAQQVAASIQQAQQQAGLQAAAEAEQQAAAIGGNWKTSIGILAAIAAALVLLK
jgi:hypothetical protein